MPIALIMRLCADPAAARQYETASSGGVELFTTAELVRINLHALENP